MKKNILYIVVLDSFTILCICINYVLIVFLDVIWQYVVYILEGLSKVTSPVWSTFYPPPTITNKCNYTIYTSLNNCQYHFPKKRSNCLDCCLARAKVHWSTIEKDNVRWKSIRKWQKINILAQLRHKHFLTLTPSQLLRKRESQLFWTTSYRCIHPKLIKLISLPLTSELVLVLKKRLLSLSDPTKVSPHTSTWLFIAKDIASISSSLSRS